MVGINPKRFLNSRKLIQLSKNCWRPQRRPQLKIVTILQKLQLQVLLQRKNKLPPPLLKRGAASAERCGGTAQVHRSCAEPLPAQATAVTADGQAGGRGVRRGKIKHYELAIWVRGAPHRDGRCRHRGIDRRSWSVTPPPPPPASQAPGDTRVVALPVQIRVPVCSLKKILIWRY